MSWNFCLPMLSEKRILGKVKTKTMASIFYYCVKICSAQYQIPFKNLMDNPLNHNEKVLVFSQKGHEHNEQLLYVTIWSSYIYYGVFAHLLILENQHHHQYNTMSCVAMWLMEFSNQSTE